MMDPSRCFMKTVAPRGGDGIDGGSWLVIGWGGNPRAGDRWCGVSSMMRFAGNIIMVSDPGRYNLYGLG